MTCGTKRDIEAEQQLLAREAALRAEADAKKRVEQKIEAYHINITVEQTGQTTSAKQHRIEIPSRTFTVAAFRELVAKAEGVPVTSVTQLYVKAPGAASPRVLIDDSKGGKLLTMADVDGLLPATAAAGAAAIMPECILVLAAESVQEDEMDEEDQLEYALALSEGRTPNLKKKATDVKEIVRKLLNPDDGPQQSTHHGHPLTHGTKHLQEKYCDACGVDITTEAWQCRMVCLLPYIAWEHCMMPSHYHVSLCCCSNSVTSIYVRHVWNNHVW